MTEPSISFLRVSGSFREVGAAIGEACADTVRRECSFEDASIPSGRTRAEQLALAERYREVTARSMPWIIEELEGCAEATGVDPRALFACSIEEIWYEPRLSTGAAAITGRCTDMVAVPPSTADGHVLTAHNNDMPRQYMQDLVAIERRVDGDPSVFTIGNGLWLWVGWNSAGMNLTGNELSPNDERIGIPREIQVRAMLRERTLDGMVAVALHPERASSYNNVLVDSGGGVANVEASATDAVVSAADERGVLAHTNHYVCEAMLPYEGDPEYAELSAIRYARASQLLAGAESGTVTPEVLRGFLSDHENAPDSICRHDHPDRESFTCFWSIADMTEGRIEYGRGNPCDSMTQVFEFEDHLSA
jgi:Acyl-coenzyme A:6-aminopenicillanic acid acyl-transferase.